MLILAIADLHGSTACLARLAERASRADLLLIAGDITDFGGAKEAKKILSFLRRAGGELAAVPGNCDTRGVGDYLAEEGICADGRFVEAGGARVIGAGGSPFRSGLTPYERRDEDLKDGLLLAFEGLAEAGRASEKPLIVLTHAPPKASGADHRKGADVGSRALREALDRITPCLWVCGHIHESPCAALSGRTLVLNPGALHDGRYAFARLERGSDGAWRANAELFELE